MIHRTRLAFTLIELLVVIAIIGLLAAIALPIYGAVQLNAKKTQSLSNMRQLGVALVGYCSDNNDVLPTQGNQNPTWAANTSTDLTAWYNVLPHNYGNGKGLSDYANDTADFYAKGSMFYVPAAAYPSTKLQAPLFAVAYNSKLSGTLKDASGASVTVGTNSVRLPLFQLPAQTCVFQESGLPGEQPVRTSQSSYNGQAYSFASRTVARYASRTILVFADGHADAVLGTDIVDTTGKAYFPQNLGKAYWSMDPTLNVN